MVVKTPMIESRIERRNTHVKPSGWRKKAGSAKAGKRNRENGSHPLPDVSLRNPRCRLFE